MTAHGPEGPAGAADSPSLVTTGALGVRDRTRSRTPSVPTRPSSLFTWVRAHLWQLTAATLAVWLAAAAAVAAHLWDVSDQWEARANELTELNYQLADDLAAEQVALLTQEQQLDLLQDQRTTLQARVLDLANAVSQSGDSAATAQQRISLLTDLLTTGSAVANKLNRCIDSQTQLASYTATPDLYDSGELADFASGVEQLCAEATAENFQFQQQLTP